MSDHGPKEGAEAEGGEKKKLTLKERLEKVAHGVAQVRQKAKAVAHAHGQGDDGGPAGQHLPHGQCFVLVCHALDFTQCGAKPLSRAFCRVV